MNERSWTDLVCFKFECKDVVRIIKFRCLARRAAIDDDEDELGIFWFEFDWRIRLKVDEEEFDETKCDLMCRFRDFFRICCKRKKQSVQMLINSVGHWFESFVWNRWAGVEHRRISFSSIVFSLWKRSFITGVNGVLNEQKNSFINVRLQMEIELTESRLMLMVWQRESVNLEISSWATRSQRKIVLKTKKKIRRFSTCVKQFRQTFCLQTLHWTPNVNVKILK